MTSYQALFVKSYRFLAVLILGGILLAAGSYFSMVLIFGVNSSWGAPIILSKSSPRIATLTEQVFQARQALDTLTLELSGAKTEQGLLASQKQTLTDLIGRYEASLAAEKQSDARFQSRLSGLVGQKQAVNAKAAEVVRANRVLSASIDKELKAGLITADMAASARAQVVSTEAAYNDGQIGAATLEHQVGSLSRGVATLGGGAASPQALESLTHINVLKQQLMEADMKLEQLGGKVQAKTREKVELESSLKHLTNSPYYMVAYGEHDIHQYAFVPYENDESAKVGAPVYSCYLTVVLCSKVGVIKLVTHDEEKGRHPVFDRDIRGFLVELDLTDKSAAKDRALFFGHRPLWIL
ncbi:hypothetical protein [Paraburkholderia sp. A3RO-2L]|uniref:hypothetical protein n=1 Tax=unclassified Paraburkholderia TaxID=2615204 RepID=UPI003DA7BE8C